MLKKKFKLTQIQIVAGTFAAIIFYGIVGLQIYISAAVLLPWFFPSAVFLAYVLQKAEGRRLKAEG